MAIINLAGWDHPTLFSFCSSTASYHLLRGRLGVNGHQLEKNICNAFLELNYNLIARTFLLKVESDWFFASTLFQIG